MSSQRNTVAVVTACLAMCLVDADRAFAQYPSDNVSMYAHLTAGDFGASYAEDSWGYVAPSGREYAIVGVSTGTAFVEITDPSNPVIIDVLGQPNRGRDMKVYQSYVYSSSDSGPTHVYDLSDIDNGVITHVRSFNQGTHNLAVDEVSGFLYLAVGGPMRVYDLSDPSNPTHVGTWGGQTHDAQVVTYTEGTYAGRQIAFVYAGWDGWLDIVDVTDKSNMFPIGRANYPNPGYTHQGWLTADRQHLYLSDEVDDIPRTTIIDVSDLSNPTFVSDFTTGLDSTDHNLYVKNGFIFAANYTSGLRIFDARDPLNPVEVGYFDTYPSNNNPGYDGAWNAFPYFPSGTVIVSDRDSGLFILNVSAAVGGLTGDLNCDGQVDAFDIEPFLTALFDPAGYPSSYPDCDINLADINGDGYVDAFDIEPFLNLLFP